MFVLPRVTAPALLSLETIVASYGETKFSSILEPQVVLMFLVQKISFVRYRYS